MYMYLQAFTFSLGLLFLWCSFVWCPMLRLFVSRVWIADFDLLVVVIIISVCVPVIVILIIKPGRLNNENSNHRNTMPNSPLGYPYYSTWIAINDQSKLKGKYRHSRRSGFIANSLMLGYYYLPACSLLSIVSAIRKLRYRIIYSPSQDKFHQSTSCHE